MVEEKKRPRGRPTSLTAEVKRQLLQAVSGGSYYNVACRYAGVSYSAFRQWIRRGEREIERVGQSTRRSVRGRERIFVEFVEELKQAEAQGEVAVVLYWRTQSMEDWRAARDFLARRYPQRWGRQRVEVTGEGGGPIKITEIEVEVDRGEGEDGNGQ